LGFCGCKQTEDQQRNHRHPEAATEDQFRHGTLAAGPSFKLSMKTVFLSSHPGTAPRPASDRYFAHFASAPV
jgi:hypothetical protein